MTDQRPSPLRAKETTPFGGWISFSGLNKGTLGRGLMTENHPAEFACPGCGSGYRVVRVKADSDLPHRLIHCSVCKHPLTAMDGQHVLKYFLVRRAKGKQQP